MTPDELREIIQLDEGPKLDFKREYNLQKTPPSEADKNEWRQYREVKWNELAIDLMALANGSYWTVDQTAYLIIGVADEPSSDGTRELFDTSYLDEITEKSLLEMIEKRLTPPIRDIGLNRIELDNKTITVIEIPPTPYIYRLSQTLYCPEVRNFQEWKKTKRKSKENAGTAYIRMGESNAIGIPDEEDLKAIEDEKKRVLGIGSEFAPYEIHPSEIALDTTFVFPDGEFKQSLAVLDEKRILWILGQTGVGKKTWALHLAQAYFRKNKSISRILRIPHNDFWDFVARKAARKMEPISNTILIVPEALGRSVFDRDNLNDDLDFLDTIYRNGNFLILTSPDSIFEQAIRETRLSEQDWYDPEKLFTLSQSTYDLNDKFQFFLNLVEFAHGVKETISDEQRRWAYELSEHPVSVRADDRSPGIPLEESKRFRKLLEEKWLPVDISNFVSQELPKANNPEDISISINLEIDVENRVHRWFADLDSSEQVFLLVFTLLNELPEEDIWEKYKLIVSSLREFDQRLACLPIGIARQRVAPYVSEHGPLKFSNPAIQSAVESEIARYYQEYFIEILPLLQKWAMPEELKKEKDKESREQMLKATASIRDPIFRAIGSLGRYRLESFSALLDEWVDLEYGNIARTVALIIKQASADPLAYPQIVSILGRWSSDRSAKQRRWVAAYSIGEIIKTRPKPKEEFPNLYRFLLGLAKDYDSYIVSAAANAVYAISENTAFDEINQLLLALTKDDDYWTRKQLIRLLSDTIRRKKITREKALRLLEAWSKSPSIKTKRTALYILLVTQGRVKSDRPKEKAILKDAIFNDPNEFIRVLVRALRDAINKTDRSLQKALQRSLLVLLGKPEEVNAPLLSALLGLELRAGRREFDSDQFLSQELKDLVPLWSEIDPTIPDVVISKLEQHVEWRIETSLGELSQILETPTKTVPSLEDISITLQEKIADPNQTLIIWLALGQLIDASTDEDLSKLANIFLGADLRAEGLVDALISNAKDHQNTSIDRLLSNINRLQEQRQNDLYRNLWNLLRENEPIQFIDNLEKQLNKVNRKLVMNSLEELAEFPPSPNGHRHKLVDLLAEAIMNPQLSSDLPNLLQSAQERPKIDELLVAVYMSVLHRNRFPLPLPYIKILNIRNAIFMDIVHRGLGTPKSNEQTKNALKTIFDHMVYKRWTRVPMITKLADSLSELSITQEDAEQRLAFLAEVTNDVIGVKSVILSKGRWNYSQ